MQEILNKLTTTKSYILLANILLVFFLVVFSNLKIIPLRMGDFVFFAFIFLALALYRPGWAFLVFIGTIILENINLAPEALGIFVRPYQFIGGLIILAIIIRLVSRRLNFKLSKPAWPDYLVIVFVLAGFLSCTAAPDKISSFKLSLILGTFGALFFLVRNYIQNNEDLKRIIPFFLSSSIVVVFYGIWQNVRFLRGLSSFEAMPGRSNGTFTEADWLGIYLVLLIAVLYALIYFFQLKARSNSEQIYNFQPASPAGGFTIFNKFSISKLSIINCFLYFILTTCYVLLILTVSRSAWLGAAAVTFIFLFTIWTNLRFRNWQWMETIKIKLKVIASLLIAIAVVYVFHLTNFQLFNRAQSTGTGLQKITIACDENINLPEKIENVGELAKYNCRFINLEDIEKEKSQGKYVTEIYRNDPNVNIRNVIYKKSWEQIKKHPILGIGWGSIGGVLGKDERGVVLNSSNIFLEVYLGAGILGFLAFIILWFYILFQAIKNYFFAQDYLQKAVSLFILLSWFAFLATNLFNAGIFLGIFWVWLAVAQLKVKN